jgi:uncharacterized LabA/DUF88 family protein
MGQACTLMKKELEFEGETVYLSYNANSPREKKLRSWATNKLGRFPGVEVCIYERKPKGPLTCQACNRQILICPHCSAKISKTIEKGVDTAIVTDLLSLAWEKAWDIAILVSSDRDYIPAVKKLATKGFHVINAYFPPTGMDLASTCWANIDIRPGLQLLKRTN